MVTRPRNIESAPPRLLTLASVALAFAAGLVWAPEARTAEDRVVRAIRFELVDEAGRVAAELALRDGSPTLTFFDPQGRERLGLAHGDEATGLSLFDDSETVRVGVMQFAHGGGGVALHGPGSRGAAVLYYKERGSLTFYGEGGEVLERLPAE